MEGHVGDDLHESSSEPRLLSLLVHDTTLDRPGICCRTRTHTGRHSNWTLRDTTQPEYARRNTDLPPNVMPKALNTLCSASQPHLRATSHNAHVWVSDGLLSRTFNAFVRNHRRHGSSVPGPLEAQRRSAKRRLTSLGHSAIASNSFDPAGLFGCQPQSGWWKTPETAGHNHRQPTWGWPFLAPHQSPVPTLPVPASPTTTDPIRDDSIPRHVKRSRAPEEQLSERLKQTHAHEALMGVLDEASIDLIRKPHLARRILWHMTRHKWDFDEVAAFLLEPRTNPAGSANHAYLFKHWQTHVNLLSWLLERDIFLQAADLGLLSVDSLKKIVLLTHELDSSIFPSGSDRTTFCNKLLEAVENSKVLRLRDLDESFLIEWLQHVRRSEFQASSPLLLWRLCGVFGSDDALLLRKVISISISMITRSSIHLLPCLVDFMLAKPHELVNQTIFVYTWMLSQQCPGSSSALTWAETRKTAIAEASFRKALIARTRADRGRASTSTQLHGAHLTTRSSPANSIVVELDREPSKVELWYAILADLGTTKSNQFTLCQSTFEEWVTDGKANSGDRDRLLVGFWVVMALSVRDDSALVRFKDIALGQLVYASFVAKCEQREQDVLASILTSLRDFGLPARNKLLRRLQTFSDGLINVRSSYETLQAQMTSLNKRDLARLSENLFYSSVRHHFPHLLTSAAESVNKDLAKFERISCDIIRDVKGSINLVFRLLFHNAKLNFALSRAASGMAKDTRMSLQEDRAAPTDEAIGGYTYVQLVEMIDNLAMECAVTTNLSDRNAFRKVYWLHMYLQMHCAPLTSRMRRALWHAVAVRPVTPTYSMVKYVYDLVVDYEGWDAAQELLRTSATQTRKQVSNAAEAKRLEQILMQAVSQDDNSLRNESGHRDRFKLVEAQLEDGINDDGNSEVGETDDRSGIDTGQKSSSPFFVPFQASQHVDEDPD